MVISSVYRYTRTNPHVFMLSLGTLSVSHHPPLRDYWHFKLVPWVLYLVMLFMRRFHFLFICVHSKNY